MPLGPQCLHCKKRRIKCDSGKPRCKRCGMNNIDCPGYVKGCKFVAVNPQMRKSTGRREAQPHSKPEPSLVICKSSTDSRSDVEATLQRADGGRSSKSTNLNCIVPSLDDRFGTTVEYIECFIRDISPDLSAVYWKTENAVTVRDWIQTPPMVQNMLITSVLAVRVLRSNANPTEMYKYRGKVLADLHDYFQQPDRQTLPTSITCLMSVLEQEVHLSPLAGFKVHLDAALQLVQMCGGVEKCLRLWPESLPREMLVIFVQIDVVSATTTSTSNLSRTVSRQSDSIAAFDSIEAKLLDSPFPCPLRLFETIARINELRAHVATAREGDPSWQTNFLQLLADTHAFNAQAWASELDCLPASSPLDPAFTAARDEWTAMARCFQSATLIYLARSTINTESFQRSMHNAQAEAFSASVAEGAQSQLQRDLRYLFKSYPTIRPTPESPALWRFSVWPLVMFTYETTVLGQTAAAQSLVLDHSESLQDSAGNETLFAQLQRIGTCLGSCSLTAGAMLLEGVAKGHRPIKWDGLFAKSCCFML